MMRNVFRVALPFFVLVAAPVFVSPVRAADSFEPNALLSIGSGSERDTLQVYRRDWIQEMVEKALSSTHYDTNLNRLRPLNSQEVQSWYRGKSIFATVLFQAAQTKTALEQIVFMQSESELGLDRMPAGEDERYFAVDTQDLTNFLVVEGPKRPFETSERYSFIMNLPRNFDLSEPVSVWFGNDVFEEVVFEPRK